MRSFLIAFVCAQGLLACSSEPIEVVKQPDATPDVLTPTVDAGVDTGAIAPAVCTPSSVSLAKAQGNQDLIIVKGWVYWIGKLSDQVFAMKRDGTDMRLVSSGETFVKTIVADDANVYWSDIMGLRKSPLGSGNVTKFDGIGSGAWSLTVDNSSIYISPGFGNTVSKLDKNAPGAPSSFTAAPAADDGGTIFISGITTNSTSVITTSLGGNNDYTKGATVSVDKNGGNYKVLSTPGANAALADDSNIWIIDKDMALFRVPVAGGPATKINGLYAQNLAQDAKNLYVASYGGVWQVSKTDDSVQQLTADHALYVTVDDVCVYYTADDLKTVSKK